MSRPQPVVENEKSAQNAYQFGGSYLLFVIPDINGYGVVVNNYSVDLFAACTMCC